MARPKTTTSKGSAIFLSLLVPTLMLCAFILSVVGTASKGWTYRVERDPDSRECMGINHRGPFQYCVLVPKVESSSSSTTATATATDESAIATATEEISSSSSTSTSCPLPNSESRFKQSCTVVNSPGSACAVKDSETISITGLVSNGATNDSSHFCQQIRIGGALLIAGCALIGIGMLATLILSGISLLQLFGRYKAPDDTSSPSIAWVSLVTSIIATLGFLAMLFGTLVSANDLVNLQSPSADWYGSGDFANSSNVGPWLIGQSVAVATAGWVLAAVGSSLITKIWPGPNVYYQEMQQDELGDEVMHSRAKTDT
ncbi:hypothetical protein HII31_06126 [Pseudocercospora fuligena]|uniref:Uncharacterized protein n=1 Tax=Pseudocercospora fuligena TaxID=685502 RepID=A0A8H6VI80_9PEZI|nr:hypothetical protein HII31_06126 [Pseudocercospora fuligena]